MASDCNQVYVSTYKQGLTNGLTDAAASSMAQAAMNDCLAKQARQTPVVNPIVSVPGTVLQDPGPTMAPKRSR